MAFDSDEVLATEYAKDTMGGEQLHKISGS